MKERKQTRKREKEKHLHNPCSALGFILESFSGSWLFSPLTLTLWISPDALLPPSATVWIWRPERRISPLLFYKKSFPLSKYTQNNKLDVFVFSSQFPPWTILVVMKNPGTQQESFYAPRILERRFKSQCRNIWKVCCILEKLCADCASWGTAWWCSLLGLQVCSVLASWLWRSVPIIGTLSMTTQPTTQVRATWVHIPDCGGLLKVRQLNSNPLLWSVVCVRCQWQCLQMNCGWAVMRFRKALSVKLLCVKRIGGRNSEFVISVSPRQSCSWWRCLHGI